MREMMLRGLRGEVRGSEQRKRAEQEREEGKGAIDELERFPLSTFWRATMATFPTGSLSDLKEQYVRENSNSKQIFLKALQHFLDVKSAGNPAAAAITSQLPIVNGKLLDLYELYHKADRRRGYEAITQANLWRAVATEMGITTSQMPDENMMKDWYGKFLAAFETAIKRRTSLQASSSTQNKRPLPQPSQMPVMANAGASQRHFPAGPTSVRPPAMPLDTAGQPLIKRAKTTQIAPVQSHVFSQAPQQHGHLQQQSKPTGTYGGSSTSVGPSSTQPASASTSTSQSVQQAPLTSCISTTQIHAAIANIESSDINKVHAGLNYLMQATMEADNPLQARNAVFLEKYPSLLTALGDLLDVANPFTKILFTFANEREDCEGTRPTRNETQPETAASIMGANGCTKGDQVISDHTTIALTSDDVKKNRLWREKNPLDGDNVLRSLARSLDSNMVLIAALSILRNLSFEIQNMQVMSCSAPVMQHLVALVMVASCSSATAPAVVSTHMSRLRNSSLMQASSYAIDTIYHIGRYVDITGKKRLSYSGEDTWLRNSLQYDGLERDTIKLYLSDHMSANSTDRYITATSHLLPALLECITRSSERDIVRRCLGVLCKLVGVQENVDVMARFCPDRYLVGLVNLLCTSTTTAEILSTVTVGDSLSGPDPLPSAKWDRVPACSGIFGHFSDVEIRDMTLEALRALCSFADGRSAPNAAVFDADNSISDTATVSMKARLASLPSFLRILSDIICTASKGMKTEGFTRALALLSELSLDPKNRVYLAAIERDICVRSLSDESVADALCTGPMRGSFVESAVVVGDIVTTGPAESTLIT